MPNNTIQAPLLRNPSRDSLLADQTKKEDNIAAKLSEIVKEEPQLPKTTIIKVHRETEDESSSKVGGKLHHHRSIELMRMLEDTPPLAGRSVQQQERLETASTLDDIGSVYSIGTECSSNMASAMNSNEDLTRKVREEMAAFIAKFSW